MAKENKKKFFKGIHIADVLTYIFLGFGLLLMFGIFWLFKTFPNVHLDELLYQMVAPIQGTNSDMIKDFILTALLPAAGGLLVGIVILSFIRKATIKRVFRTLYTILAAVMIAFSSSMAWNRLDVNAFMTANTKENRLFIEDNYVDPTDVDITFPEQKRNLLFIYLESMENTFTSKENGGAFDEDLIPEITAMAQEGENFNGNAGTLNGANALTGSTWTVGSMFSSSSGLPLKIALTDHNDMSTQSQFFATTKTMGDILWENGYSNTLLVGSDAEFGGRKLYYSTHGDYEIIDHPSMQKAHKLPSDDYVAWWGFEDKYLYQFAQEKLTELSQSEQPFNLTMLTVDTHFEDGYKCSLCGNEHPDDQYADVYSCASRQLGAFIEWCKQQPWYENTTIVITGDHPTMDADFCEDVDPNYQRKVVSMVLNSPTVNQVPETYREYSTFDLFPTTLAALGADIPGNRLGLGTDLYSGAETLTELYGVKEENLKLMAHSAFMTKRANLSEPEQN